MVVCEKDVRLAPLRASLFDTAVTKDRLYGIPPLGIETDAARFGLRKYATVKNNLSLGHASTSLGDIVAYAVQYAVLVILAAAVLQTYGHRTRPVRKIPQVELESASLVATRDAVAHDAVDEILLVAVRLEVYAALRRRSGSV